MAAASLCMESEMKTEMHETSEVKVRTGIARLAGAMYLLTMSTALFAEGYVRGSLLDGDSATLTAQNIVQSSLLFRLGIAADLITATGVVILVWSLHQLLKPVDARLALLGAFFRLVEIGIHFSAIVFSVIAVSLLSGSEYTRAFEAQQLHSLAGFVLRAQGAGLNIGFIPLGIGSAIFALLLFRSGYVPRVLAGWGVFASLLLATYAFGSIVAPSVRDFFILGMVPMFVYEVTLGSWLLLTGTAARAPLVV